MKKLLILLFSFLLLSSPYLKAEIIFYCQSDLATGFVKQNGSWTGSKFKNKRWTIKFNDSYSKLYGLEEDNQMPSYLCSAPYRNAPHLLACLSGFKNGQSFMFNKIKNRFVFNSSSVTGYTSEDSDTNPFYAGTCSKF